MHIDNTMRRGNHYCEYLQASQYGVQSRHLTRTNSRSPLLNSLLVLTLASHVPKPTLVPRERTVVPHVHEDTVHCQPLSFFTLVFFFFFFFQTKGNKPLTPIDVIFLLQLLYSDRHAILGKHDIALLHLLTCGVCDLLDDAVGDEADNGEDGEHDEEDNEGEEACSGHFFWF